MDIEERRKLFLRAMGQDPDQTEEAAPSEAPVSRGKNPSAARVSQPGRGRAAVRKTPAKRVRMTAAQRNPAEHAPVSSGRKNPVQRVQNPADRTKLPVNRVKTAKTAASGHPLDRLADSIRYYGRYGLTIGVAGILALLMVIGLISVVGSAVRPQVAAQAGDVAQDSYVMTAAENGAEADEKAEADTVAEGENNAAAGSAVSTEAGAAETPETTAAGAPSAPAITAAAAATEASAGTTAAQTAASGVYYPVDISGIQTPDWITQEFIRPNEYSRPMTPLQSVSYIVIHWVANPGSTAEGNREYFDNLGNPEDPYYGVRKASAQLIVGLQGEVIQTMPLNEMAYAVQDVYNPVTINIEVCHEDWEGEFSDTTKQSLYRLTSWLMQQFHLDIDHVIRHYDCTGKDCPKYYVDETQWAQLKSEIEAYNEAHPDIQ